MIAPRNYGPFAAGNYAGDRYCLYLATNLINGRRYVGITADFDRRWRGHIACATTGCTHAFHRAIRKYGRDNFGFTLMPAGNDWRSAGYLEKEMIEENGTKCPGGYNMTDGGDGVVGMPVSDATREKLKRALADPAVKAKMRQAKLGKSLTEDHRRKVLAKGHSPAARANAAISNTGRRNTPQSIEKMRLACVGRRPSEACIAARRRQAGDRGPIKDARQLTIIPVVDPDGRRR